LELKDWTREESNETIEHKGLWFVRQLLATGSSRANFNHAFGFGEKAAHDARRMPVKTPSPVGRTGPGTQY
jgi:hypothetical protein